MEEYIILVDDKKNILGTAPKLASHNANTPLHLAFSVFLFNERGEVLLQQRSHTKKTWPLIWSNTCCGHQKLNEKLETTAKNRLAFELGIMDASLMLMLPDFRYICKKDGIVENEFCPVFVGKTSQEPRINADEVESVQWILWEAWLKEIATHPDDYSYWSIKETEEIIKEHAFIQIFLKNISS